MRSGLIQCPALCLSHSPLQSEFSLNARLYVLTEVSNRIHAEEMIENVAQLLIHVLFRQS